LEEEVAEGGAGSKVGGEGAGERVDAEAEGVEVGELREHTGGKLTGESDGGEVELHHGGFGIIALDARPGAGRREGGVPEKRAAAHGGAQGEERRALRREVGECGREEEEEEKENGEKECVRMLHCCFVFLV